jgi:hypothetical protein
MRPPSEYRATILAALQTRALTAQAAGEVIGRTAQVARHHLWQLVKNGIAGFKEVRNRKGGLEKVTVFFVLPPKPDPETNRPRPTTYPQNHKRDDLVAALFGPAQQRNEQ